jgi:mannose-6-phosphate isomerase-like protein (cupin superfamily)
MTLTSYVIAEGAPDVHEHHHPEEEAWSVIEGKLRLFIGEAELDLGPGEVAVVAPNAPHRVRALQASRAFVVDSPARLQLPGSAH